MPNEVKLLPEYEKALKTDPAVFAEMCRINAVSHPSYAGEGDREDLITYAKEIVALRTRPTIVTDEVVEPVGVLAEVREQLATLADKQADQRGDYLYRGQPDTWLLEAIRKLDTAIAAMPAIVGGE